MCTYLKEDVRGMRRVRCVNRVKGVRDIKLEITGARDMGWCDARRLKVELTT